MILLISFASVASDARSRRSASGLSDWMGADWSADVRVSSRTCTWDVRELIVFLFLGGGGSERIVVGIVEGIIECKY